MGCFANSGLLKILSSQTGFHVDILKSLFCLKTVICRRMNCQLADYRSLFTSEKLKILTVEAEIVEDTRETSKLEKVKQYNFLRHAKTFRYLIFCYVQRRFKKPFFKPNFKMNIIGSLEHELLILLCTKTSSY